MPYTLAFSPDATYLECTHVGVVTLEELERARLNCVAALASRNCLRLLVDVTGKAHAVNMFDLYRLSSGGASAWPALLRITLIYLAAHEREALYFTDLSIRSGINIRAFTERQAAVEWLLDDHRLSDNPPSTY